MNDMDIIQSEVKSGSSFGTLDSMYFDDSNQLIASKLLDMDNTKIRELAYIVSTRLSKNPNFVFVRLQSALNQLVAEEDKLGISSFTYVKIQESLARLKDKKDNGTLTNRDKIEETSNLILQLKTHLEDVLGKDNNEGELELAFSAIRSVLEKPQVIEKFKQIPLKAPLTPESLFTNSEKFKNIRDLQNPQLLSLLLIDSTESNRGGVDLAKINNTISKVFRANVEGNYRQDFKYTNSEQFETNRTDQFRNLLYNQYYIEEVKMGNGISHVSVSLNTGPINAQNPKIPLGESRDAMISVEFLCKESELATLSQRFAEVLLKSISTKFENEQELVDKVIKVLSAYLKIEI